MGTSDNFFHSISEICKDIRAIILLIILVLSGVLAFLTNVIPSISIEAPNDLGYEFGKIYTANTDGFVTAWISTHKQPKAYLTGEVGIESMMCLARDSAGKPGSSDGSISFPVPKGYKWHVYLNDNTDNNIIRDKKIIWTPFKHSWIPLLILTTSIILLIAAMIVLIGVYISKPKANSADAKSRAAD